MATRRFSLRNFRQFFKEHNIELYEVPNNMLQFTEEDEMHDKFLKWHFIQGPHEEQFRNLRNFKYFGYLTRPKDITPVIPNDMEISI